MVRRPLNDEELLDISLRCAEVIHEYDGNAPTSALVAASGLSERTFFRYFPTKAESIRPFLDAGSRRFSAVLTQHLSRSAASVFDAVVTALPEAFAGVRTPWTHHLMQLVLTVPALRRVWLESNEDLVDMLLPTLARALGLSPDSAEARIAADQAALLAESSVRRMVHLDENRHQAVAKVAAAFRSAPLSRRPQSSTS
jgi:AcrR family transcriptional regulator